jgi:branched-chain amino acid transport system permease protein
MTSTRKASLWFLLAGVLLWFFPNLADAADFPLFYLLFAYSIFFWVAQASAWNMFTGYSGYFSFGQGAFFGMGVYATATLAAKQGWPLLVAIPIGGVVAAALGLAVGFVVFRLRKLRGEIFALLTLAVAFVVAALFRVVPSIDGGNGIPLNQVELPTFLGDYQSMIFRLGLIVALVTVFASFALRRSKVGWGLFAIKDDEEVAEALGVPTFRTKMTAFGISTFFAGLSGAVHAIQISYVTIEDVFNLRVPLFVIIMSVLGGLRHWMGPVVGAAVIFTLTDRLNRAGLESLNQIIIGGLLIIMVLAVKEGLFARIRERWLLGLVGFVIGVAAMFFVDPEMSAISKMAAGMGGTVLTAILPESWTGRARTPSDADGEEVTA